MAYVTGLYGIQYEERNNNNESHRIKWILGIVLLIVAVSFSYVKIKKAISSNNNTNTELIKEPTIKKDAPVSVPPIKKPIQNPQVPKKNIPLPPPLIPETTSGKVNVNTPSDPTVELNVSKEKKVVKKVPARDSWGIQVDNWLESAQTRSTTDRNLLERLSTAVREKKTSLEIDSLEKLCRRPTLVDIKDPMLRRLGELNMSLFLSNKPSRWTTEVTVKRGDSLKRIAREHGTTLAAVRTLNKMDISDRITVGDKLRVPEFPSAVLEIHKSLKIADLTLKGQFFKRYVVNTDPNKTLSGPPYPITREAGPRTRFNQLKISMSAKDLLEMDMLLAPGSSLVVTEQ
jgi:LysM repeat protein